jgi:hypothetical protein
MMQKLMFPNFKDLNRSPLSAAKLSPVRHAPAGYGPTTAMPQPQLLTTSGESLRCSALPHAVTADSSPCWLHLAINSVLATAASLTSDSPGKSDLRLPLRTIP